MNRQFGTTIIIITHNEAIAAMADVEVHIKDGTIVERQIHTQKRSAAELQL
jgi:putative ABC transport system ATP-binding protein